MQYEKVQNLVACCKFKPSQSYLSNIKSVAGSQESAIEMRQVSQIFTGDDINFWSNSHQQSVHAQVLTFSSKNELVTFNVVNSNKNARNQSWTEPMEKEDQIFYDQINQ